MSGAEVKSFLVTPRLRVRMWLAVWRITAQMAKESCDKPYSEP